MPERAGGHVVMTVGQRPTRCCRDDIYPSDDVVTVRPWPLGFVLFTGGLVFSASERCGNDDRRNSERRARAASLNIVSPVFLLLSAVAASSPRFLHHLFEENIAQGTKREEESMMNIFQRKNSKKVKDTDGSQKKKSDLFDRARGGLDALAGGLQSAKNDAEKLQGDVKAGIGTILQTGSGILEKAKAEFGSHSEATPSKKLEQGSEGTKKMEAFSAVLDKVKSNPEVVEKVKEEVMNLAEALHLTKHESKEPEADEKAKDGEEGTSAGKTDEGLGAVEHAVEEIQAAVASVQQHETETEASSEVAAAAEASAEGQKPEAATREAEKDDPTKRIDFFGFFAMLFERFCCPGNKKKD